MNTFSFKRQFLAIGVAFVVSLTMAIGVFAETKSNDVDITVQAGEFSLTTSAINSFGEITLQADPLTYSTSFQGAFTTKDLRGSQQGWRLDVSASPFSNGGHQLPNGSVSLAAISDINIERVGTGSGFLPKSSMTTQSIIDDGAIVVAKAETGTGMGVFTITFPDDALSLVVDATTAKTGTYTSTLTWDLVTAP